MILATDTHYKTDRAITAGVCFNNWTDSEPLKEIITIVNGIKKYEPGMFYKREMPCIIKLVENLKKLPDIIIVDGFVYLGKENKPGLGWHLFNELNNRTAIIGVAKNAFQDTPPETKIYRGSSKKPLYVTSIGIDLEKAKNCIGKMHGSYRLPTLLKHVDGLCRKSTNNPL